MFISKYLMSTLQGVVKGGGGVGADSGIYYRGAPCIGDESGDRLGP